jgi:poly(A) polymerase
MTIAASFRLTSLPNFSLRFPLRKVRLSSVAALDTFESESLSKDEESVFIRESVVGGDSKQKPAWKKLNSNDIGISNSMIPRSTRVVLDGLKQQGFDAYLVGGCVRDLILKRTPKDFDIITSAELKEVRKAFKQCRIVGSRFPICHVTVDDTTVEVSSFSTSSKKSEKEKTFSFVKDDEIDEKEHSRWSNCLQRDFTINGFFFDPYSNLVYDYLGGMEDLIKAKIRTVNPANLTLVEDPARILRGIRLAARLGFRFTRETSHNVRSLAHSLLSLSKGRLQTEMDYMFSYGSAEASLRLLWEFGLLEILLPIQAAYFTRNGYKRRDKRPNMLSSLLSSMDKYLAPDKPCHSSLWIGILAFHKALSDEPRDPRVVAAFSLAVHNGGDILEAVNISKNICKPHNTNFKELSLVPQNLDPQTLKHEVLRLAASVLTAVSNMTDAHIISQSMAEYSKAPQSDLVFITLALYIRVCKIFECVKDAGNEQQFVAKQDSKVDPVMLTLGSLLEVRHVFARVVFDTVFPIDLFQN